MNESVKDAVHPASFRDPSGFVFNDGEVLYRQVNRVYLEHYDRLMSSGLYKTLAGAGDLVRHEEADVRPVLPGLAYRVIRPSIVPFISYPGEWSFTQLKDAALLTLRIQKTALEHGMTLKDATPYNVQFVGSRPVFIDTLSFETLRPGAPWIAYRQFCETLLAPLALQALVSARLGVLQRAFPDGIALDLAARMLPGRSLLRPALLMHIHLHARSQERHADTSIQRQAADSGARSGSMSLQSLLGLVTSLENAVNSLTRGEQKSAWSSYYDTCSYSEREFEAKRNIVSEWVSELKPGLVYDIGTNTGEFSRISAASGGYVVAVDTDEASVDTLYRQCRQEAQMAIHPLVIDIADPTPGLGWNNAERTPFLKRGSPDLVLALALLHHLAIGRNLPFGKIASLFDAMAPRLLIEFVPKSDPQSQRLLKSREDIFDSYDEDEFLESFCRYFVLEKKCVISSTGRTLYLMRRNRS